MSTEKNIGILGIGNLLLRDEGFGVHAIHYLEEHYEFPPQVRLRDGGTAGIYMAPFVEEVDCLIVIDVVGFKDDPGTIHVFDGEELRGANLQMRMSPHQLGLLEVLEICRLRDKAPAEMHFIGIVPADIETGVGLSKLLADKMTAVVAIILDFLKEQGVEIDARDIPGAGVACSAC